MQFINHLIRLSRDLVQIVICLAFHKNFAPSLVQVNPKILFPTIFNIYCGLVIQESAFSLTNQPVIDIHMSILRQFSHLSSKKS